jgi:putative peptide zinc metalloprotease protein
LLFRAAFLGYFSVFINLNPLLELDGYFILSDWLGIPMLRQRAFGFIREELPVRLSNLLHSRLRSTQADTPPAGSEAETQAVAPFSRDEIIFTIFGILAAIYTVYALWLAIYFWQTRISNVLLDLWNKDPALIFRSLVALLVTLVIVPATLAIGATLWNLGRRLAGWLERRHFFERETNVALLVICGALLVLFAPALFNATARQAVLTIGSVLLAGLGAWTLVVTARQYAGAEFQATFWGLVLAASLLLIASVLHGLYLVSTSRPPGSLIGDATVLGGQLVTVGLLIAGVRSLTGVDLRRGPARERLAVVGL